MTTQLQRIIWGYTSEVVLSILMVGITLVLDRSGILSRAGVMGLATSVYGFIAAYILAGVIGLHALLAVPFGLIAFAGEDLKRRILEHDGFGVYVRAYALTFVVLVFTYLLTPALLALGTTSGYAVFMFLWVYCSVLLVTAAKNAFVFLWLIEAMHRLERDIRAGMYK